ncbi:hypothetical protein chiPu_0017677 [Chiloscyllium punctatum]|uniref:Uncharacterized protein n=1 Tax=Chiloscyllium punctatum TaxID=137246 RepID=A0A401RI57_CHIPU|nr:hypothetical protein [Chiloscyllium punctatum]
MGGSGLDVGRGVLGFARRWAELVSVRTGRGVSGGGEGKARAREAEWGGSCPRGCNGGEARARASAVVGRLVSARLGWWGGSCPRGWGGGEARVRAAGVVGRLVPVVL